MRTPGERAARDAHARYRRRLTTRHVGDDRDEMIVWSAYQGALAQLSAAAKEAAEAAERVSS